MANTPSVKQRGKGESKRKKRHVSRGTASIIGMARTSSHKCGERHGDNIPANPERENNAWLQTRPRHVMVGHRYRWFVVSAVVQLSPRNKTQFLARKAEK